MGHIIAELKKGESKTNYPTKNTCVYYQQESERRKKAHTPKTEKQKRNSNNFHNSQN